MEIGTQAPKLVVYSMSVRVGYIGALVADGEDKIVLKSVLMLERIVDPKTGEDQGIFIGPVPYASRDSNVTISKKVAPGVLIENLDADLLKSYDKEIMACYSKLKLT